MATALAIVRSGELVIPAMPTTSKIVVWKSANGVYYETIEGIRQAMTEQAILDFCAANNLSNATDMAKALAANIDRIKIAVDAALKKIN